MPSCNHKQKVCSTCSSCPRCPTCVCSGATRGRGRPRKEQRDTAQSRTKRVSFYKASMNITEAAIEYRKQEKEKAREAQQINNEVTKICLLLESIGLRHYETRLRPGRDLSPLQYKSMSHTGRARINLFLEKVCRAVLRIVLPSCVEQVMDSFLGKCYTLTEEAILDGLKTCKRGSIERRTLRGILCATNSCETLRHLFYGHHSIANDEDELGDIDDITGRTAGPEPFRDKKTTALVESHTVNAPTPIETTPATLTQPIEPIEPVGPTKQNESVTSDPCTCSFSTTCNEKNRCHVLGCFIDISLPPGAAGTATGHKCRDCEKPVHAICSERLLGLELKDADSILLCSSCALKDDGSRDNCNVDPVISPLVSSKMLNTGGKYQRSGSLARIYQISRKDWDSILCNGVLLKKQITRQRRSGEDIKIALKYLFRSDNVRLLSWGTKRLRAENEKPWRFFPAILRRATVEEIFGRYVKFCSSQSPALHPLSRSSFTTIVKGLTNGGQKQKAAVDYVLGVLCYDNLRTVREIVDAEITCGATRERLRAQVDAVEEFMKFSYLEHVGSDSDVLHDSSFAFDDKPGITPQQSRTSSCMDCMIPFQVLSNVGTHLENSEGITTALRESQQKLMLFMAHQHRCKNQQTRIQRAFEDVTRDKDVSSVLLLVDYKMKRQ